MTEANQGHDGPSYGSSTHYDAEYFAWQNSGMDVKVRVKVSRFAPFINPQDTVLDFGCAGGGLLGALDAARKIGVEINPTARESAVRDFGIEAYPTLADAPDGVADVVISNHALEHIPSPIEALTQMRSKLKPGGQLVLVLPIDDWRAQKNYDPADINHHLYTWTPLLLGNALTEAGYRVSPADFTIIHHAYMRGYDAISARLPENIFYKLCQVWSFVARRRELRAVVRAAASTSGERDLPSAADRVVATGVIGERE